MLVYRFGVRIILSLVFYFYLCQSPYRTKHAESFGYHGISSAVLASLRDRVIYYSNIGELRSERHKFKISDWASRGYTTLPSRQSYQSSSSRISPSNYWSSPRRELYIWGFTYPNFTQDSPSGYRFSPRSKLSYRWNGYSRFSQRFNWPSVLLNCSQPMGFLSDNSETHPKVGPWLWGQPFALYLLQ